MAEDEGAAIKVQKNGSYRVSGNVKLIDADGNQFEVTENPFFLCRCGGSSDKPFCDSTHKTNGFDSVCPARTGP